MKDGVSGLPTSLDDDFSGVAPEPERDTPPRECPACDGHGTIWTNWHPTPVQCGACHGSGEVHDA